MKALEQRWTVSRRRRQTNTELPAIESGDRSLDLATNAIYRLQDILIGELSPTQWRTIHSLPRTGSQEKAARKLRVNISTVSRALRRAHHWQIEDTRRTEEIVQSAYLHEKVQINILHVNMQPIAKTLLAVLLAHLLADFPLQTDALVRAKKKGFRGIAIHGGRFTSPVRCGPADFHTRRCGPCIRNRCSSRMWCCMSRWIT